MKYSFALMLACAAMFAIALPVSQSHSQLAPSVEPLAELQALQTANDDLLKRQEATLKDLTEMTTTAHEIRIFAKRG